ncbi:multidrug resistance-associated protein 1-like isoform X2 [Clavelina lepadiformis]|uniref:multidrug resistance-associated protein 1-like isoform X2 n=1 Tax=Clavelina lepadiformis TaxID=159417 RepID=UPI0040425BF8
MSLQKFCGEEFFDEDKTLNSSNPVFSNCFQQLVFDLPACVFLWVFVIPYYLVVRNSHLSYIPVSRLFKAKVFATVVLWILAWTNLIRSIWEWGQGITVPAVDLVIPLIVGLSMALASLLLQFDRMKGIRSSGLLTTYWIIFLVLWIFAFKSKIDLIAGSSSEPLTDGQVLRCITFFMSYCAVIVNFILCFFADSPSAFRAKVNDTEMHGPLIKTDEKKVEHKPCPESETTFLSSITFWWFTKMVVNGYKRPIKDEDLWILNKADRSGNITKHFLKNWFKELAKCRAAGTCVDEKGDHEPKKEAEVLIAQKKKQKKKASLLWAMCKTFGPYFLISSFLKVLQDCLAFVSPQLLSALISFASSDSPQWQGYFLAVGLFVIAIVQSVILQQYFHICFTVGMRLRSAIVAAIYQKALVLSNAARKQSTVGEVVNLMSVDAQRFMDLMSYLNIVWSGPLQIILALYFLWQVLGPSVLAGLGVMILLIPINALIASKARALQVKQMTYKDDRIKLMNEILNGMKVLKMYAWEMSFKDKVAAIRLKELKELRRAAYLNAASSFTFVCAPFMVSCTTFAVYVLSDEKNVLDAQKAFVSLSLFNLLRFPLTMLPMVVTSLVQASVSLQRLQGFLNNEELDPKNVDRSPSLPSEDAIKIENGSFKWDKEEDDVLKNITMSVPEGTLAAVVGQVGCGKSSLMSALLGDMEKVEGHVSVKGSVAYVPQQAWIQNLTVRDNITFGKQMDPCKYQDTVKACELETDFEMLPAGDYTEIGERGINLSGGQKQRVAIARAVYQDAQVYLFDDPLSAVDSHVGKNIFTNVLGPDGCLKTKTRVLVTHGLAFLPQVDRIFVLVNGEISEVGNYNELLNKNGAFAEFLRNYAVTEDDEKVEGDPTVLSMTSDMFSLNEEDIDNEVDIEEDAIANARRKFMRQQSRMSMGTGNVTTPIHGPVCKFVPLKKKLEEERVCHLPPKKEESKLIQREKAETGNVKLSVFISYMSSVGYFLSFLIILFYIMQNVAGVYSSIWLSDWSTDPVNPDGTQNGTDVRLAVFGCLGVFQALLVMLASFTMTSGSVAAAAVIHVNMISRVFHSPMSFFDTTPLGRVINRFSKDIYLIDEVIPRALSSFLVTLFSSLATIFIVIYGTPVFAAVIFPLLLLYYFVQRFYVRTSRQLKRLESVSRSPIYSHFGETVTGASTIRAYGLQKSFIKQNEEKVDINQMSYYPNIVSNRWLALRLEFVGNLMILFAAVFAVAAKGNISDGVVGLSVSYAMQITQTLNWMVRQSSELETNIVAVERVEEYSNVKQEAPLIVDDERPPDNWPADGRIKFENYSTKYRPELDLVVKDISIDIKGGEKIGIVGRTGAGKSSLTLALFRIIEAVDGCILIDGKNISKMGLQDLRSKLSIIPQDPVLFSGSLRLNLDPFDHYTDDELWDALEHSHLKNFVINLPNKLEHEVTEGGDNLSVGQRQLVCLTRALLRKSKILVLDEATAAVDLETDDLIQATIRVQFEECTTFTIAHRLNTIMDSTRVLVLDAGRIAQFDSPTNLLKPKKGIFYEMAKDAGLA